MKAKTIFYCTECGNETPKWQGRCPACGAWNTMVERPAEKAPKKAPSAGRGSALGVALNRPKTMAEVETTDELRFPTGMGELDRVLGGGAVRGSLVLVGGAPGIGKSTLMLQICDHLCRFAKVLYVSGEESERQIKLRAERLQVRGEGLYLLSETNLENVIDAVHAVSPDVLIVDSIQTLYHGDVTSAPGSISQVKECTMALMQLAKGEGLTVFVIGHVNKEGSIAGPKVLEHMVDCVLYFEGERHMAYRILRAAKNRFGATNEIGRVRDGGRRPGRGAQPLRGPAGRPAGGRPRHLRGLRHGGGAAGAGRDPGPGGALQPGQPPPGEQRLRLQPGHAPAGGAGEAGGLLLGNCDAYLNVIGGLSLDEPAADLAAILALASSFRDRPVPADLAAIGEVGLTGELRSVSALGQRLAEVRRLGFTKCLIPKRTQGKLAVPDGLELIRVGNIREALAALL